jgi:hypothetical protein
MACRVSHCGLRAQKETYATLSLTLVYPLKVRRMAAKCSEDEACVGGAAVPCREPKAGAVRNARAPSKIRTRLGGWDMDRPIEWLVRATHAS